ncbi:MAG: hypothetical protein WC708_20450 [Lentisphaeria bacterium]
MNTERPLLTIRMVVVPLPAAFRVRSTAEQFPTLEVRERSIRLLGQTLTFTDLEQLELTEEGGIRFAVKGHTFHYAAISGTSKETPDKQVTTCLFEVLSVLRQGGFEAAQAPLAALRQLRKANTKAMLVTAAILIVVCFFLAYCEDGCNARRHNQASQAIGAAAPQPER